MEESYLSLIKEWIKKMWDKHTTEYYSAFKTENYTNFVCDNNPDTEGQMLNDATSISNLKYPNS